MKFPAKSAIVVGSIIVAAALVFLAVLKTKTPEILLVIDHGETAAISAILDGKDPGSAIRPCLDRVKQMLDQSPRRIKARDEWGHTVLHYGSYHADMVHLLVSRGASVNSRRKDGNTPLHFAVGVGAWWHVSGVEALIAEGADVNAKNDNGETPLDVFVRHNAPTAHVSGGKIVALEFRYEQDPPEQRRIKEREIGRVSDALRSKMGGQHER